MLQAAAKGPKQVRLAAIDAVGRIGNATCVAPLLESAAEGDAEIANAAKDALAEILDVQEVPRHAWVSRWPDALPVFDPAHRARIAALETALAPHRIILAGSAFCGSGLDAAVVSGNRAAERVLAG